MQLLQKYCGLDFTTADHGILHNVVLLRGNLLHLKELTSSSIMSAVEHGSIPSFVFDIFYICKSYNKSVVLWSKYKNLQGSPKVLVVWT